PGGWVAGPASGVRSAAESPSGVGGRGGEGVGHGADPPCVRYAWHKRASSSKAHGHSTTVSIVSLPTTRASSDGFCRVCFEFAKTRLQERIIVAVVRSAHALLHASPSQYLTVFAAGILAASVTMVD